jgi:hypothetical protein
MLSLARKLTCVPHVEICDAEQLYTDGALVLDASTRVAPAAGSCLIDLHLHCVVNGALESKVATTMLVLGLARKLTLRASLGSHPAASCRCETTRSCVSDGRCACGATLGVAQSDGTDAIRSVATRAPVRINSDAAACGSARRRCAMHVHIKDAASCAHCPTP